jgi:quinoprotein glucose dehydrogenase
MGVAPKGNNYGILQFHGPKASVAVTASGLLLAATPDSKFRAWDKDTGRVLWSDDLPDRAGGIPAIYEIGGKEYITISVRGRYITYALSDGRTQPSTGKQ